MSEDNSKICLLERQSQSETQLNFISKTVFSGATEKEVHERVDLVPTLWIMLRNRIRPRFLLASNEVVYRLAVLPGQLEKCSMCCKRENNHLLLEG